MSPTREKFATQVDGELLAGMRELAKTEGRQLQALVDEAFAGLLEQRHQARPRPHVMATFRRSLTRFGPLYEKLAK